MDTPPVFTVRQNWRGQIILLVKTYETLPHSGQWREATSKHLIQFFQYLDKGGMKEKP